MYYFSHSWFYRKDDNIHIDTFLKPEEALLHMLELVSHEVHVPLNDLKADLVMNNEATNHSTYRVTYDDAVVNDSNGVPVMRVFIEGKDIQPTTSCQLMEITNCNDFSVKEYKNDIDAFLQMVSIVAPKAHVRPMDIQTAVCIRNTYYEKSVGNTYLYCDEHGCYLKLNNVDVYEAAICKFNTLAANAPTQTP